METAGRRHFDAVAEHERNIGCAKAGDEAGQINAARLSTANELHLREIGVRADAVATLFIDPEAPIYEPEIASALICITRATVIRLANDLGYEVKAKRLTRDDVYLADEAFFTGTAAEVTPIRELDGRQIGEGKRGPLTTKLQALFFDVVNGRAEQYREWLTPVK